MSDESMDVSGDTPQRVRQDRASRIEGLQLELARLHEIRYDSVVRYIFIRIGDRNDAQDLGGEVFLRALRSLDSYRAGHEQMQSWLFKIAHNLVVDHLRKRKKQKITHLDEVEIPDDGDIDEVVETSLRVPKLARALEQLTENQREVIGLRFFGGLSSAETGRMMGKSDGAVREMQRAALSRLRELMNDTEASGLRPDHREGGVSW